MPTWHQQRRPVPLYHAVKWTVVEDAPGTMTSVTRFDTEEQAHDHMVMVKNRGRRAYVLSPAGV